LNEVLDDWRQLNAGVSAREDKVKRINGNISPKTHRRHDA
jgi:hypothetical protein